MIPNLSNPPRRSRRTLMMGVAGLLALGLAGAAFYGVRGAGGNSAGAPGASTCAASSAASQRATPLAKGEVAAVNVARQPMPAVPVSFAGPDGTPRTLADFKGRTVLLNLWATWCVPCRQEMPALDRLQAELGGPDFEVVAVNMDTRNLDKPKAWLAETGVTRLAYYADPQAKMFQDLKRAGKVVGLPTTLLIDGNGCEIAALSGPAEWSSPDGLSLIRAALGR